MITVVFTQQKGLPSLNMGLLLLPTVLEAKNLGVMSAPSNHVYFIEGATSYNK